MYILVCNICIWYAIVNIKNTFNKNSAGASTRYENYRDNRLKRIL